MTVNLVKVKFAEDVLDYGFKWDEFLDSTDTINTALISATPSGLTINVTVIDTVNQKASALIAGGTIGASYQVQCKITTVGGLTANSVQTLVISETAR